MVRYIPEFIESKQARPTGERSEQAENSTFLDYFLTLTKIASILFQTRTVTADYTIATTDYSVICNKGTAMTITLPSASGSGRLYSVKNIGAGVVTLDGDSSDTIDGDTTQVLYQWEGVNLIDYASNVWVVI